MSTKPVTTHVIVTRHPELVEHILELGLAPESTPVLEHAEGHQVLGKHVIGVLPLHLACLAESVTTVPLELPPELRGKDLTLGEVRQFARRPTTYRVEEADRPREFHGPFCDYDCPCGQASPESRP